MLKSKKTFKIGTINTQTLQKVWKIPELIATAEKTGQEVICIQEHRFVHLDVDIKEHTFGKWKLLTCSAWRNSINAAIGGVGILINLRAYNAIKSIDMISNRIVAIHFMGNPLTTVISCYSPTNMSDQEETERFYVDLTSYTRHIPKHNVLVIGGDFNAHLGKENGYKYSFYINTNRNGNMLKISFMKIIFYV